MTALSGEPASARHLASVLGPGSRRPLMAAHETAGVVTLVLGGAPAPAAERELEPLTVHVPTSRATGPVVEHEARTLVELRRMRLGPVEATIPRHAGTLRLDGLPVTLASTPPGQPMTASYRRWLHTANPALVAHDFSSAGHWLARFQEASAGEPSPSTWAGEVADAVRARWDGRELLVRGLERLARAAAELDGVPVPRSAVHGDFSPGVLMLDEGGVCGVVDWRHGQLAGSPLRDLARFGLRYAAGLDQHTRPGHRVIGHPGLRRVGPAPGVRHALCGRGWFPRQVRGFLASGLHRLGAPRTAWYALALAGLGDLAAHGEEAEARDHLEVLATLPER